LQIASTVPIPTLQQALKGELAFFAISPSGKLQYATGIQDAGVLDDLYYYPGRLGVATIVMHENNGVWVAVGDPTWKNKYYFFSVNVWVLSDAAIDTNITTYPYSVDIALNGAKSRITDLSSGETKPDGVRCLQLGL
jgi:pullulanase